MKTEYSNNFPPNETRLMQYLWDVHVDRILKVMLSDGKWYTVKNNDGNNWLQITGYIGNKPYYFSLGTVEEYIDEDGIEITKLKRISGLVNQIKLIEEEVS